MNQFQSNECNTLVYGIQYVLNKSSLYNRININGSSGNRSQIVLGIIIMKLPTGNKITLCISKLLTNLSLSVDG